MKQFFQRLKGFSFFDTFKHASTYFSGTILIQGLGVITLPVYTYFMSTAEYGIANVYMSYITIATAILSLNLHWGIKRYYYENKEDFANYLGTIFIAVTIIFGSLAFGVFLFRQPIANLIKLPVHLIPYMLGFMYAMILTGIFSQICIAQKESRLKTTVEVLTHYLKFGLTVAFFFAISYNTFSLFTGQDMYMGKIIGELLAMGVASIYLLYYLFKISNFGQFKWYYIRYALHYSIPLIPMAIGGYLLTSFDQWYINATIDNESAGLYSFAYKLGMLMLGLVIALNSAIEPNYYAAMAKNDIKGIGSEILSTVKLVVLGSLFLMFFSKDLGTLLSAKDSFQKALDIVNPIVGGYVFFGIAQLHNMGINYKKQNWYLTFIMLLSGAINIVLNIYLIPIYGYEMAAYTTLASYFAMMLLSIFVTRFILRLPPLPLGGIFALLGVEIAIIGVFYGLSMNEWAFSVGSVCIKLLFFLLFALGIFYKSLFRLLRK